MVNTGPGFTFKPAVVTGVSSPPPGVSPADPPGLLHPALQVYMSAGLFALLLPGGAALVPAKAVQVHAAVHRQATRGCQARGALGMTESVAFWERDESHGRKRAHHRFNFFGLPYGLEGFCF